MQRKPLTLTVSLAAFALLALTGCSSGGDAAPAESVAPVTEAATEQTESAAPEQDTATLEGEGIAYGSETVTGLDFNTTCMGSGDTVTVSALATGEDGTQYAFSVAEGNFAFTSVASDMTSDATALAAGSAAPGTEFSVEAGEGEYTFTGTATVTKAGEPAPSNEPFTARLTCDTTL